MRLLSTIEKSINEKTIMPDSNQQTHTGLQACDMLIKNVARLKRFWSAQHSLTCDSDITNCNIRCTFMNYL